MKLFRNYKNLSDEDLMDLITNKDSKAFSELYDRYSEMIVNYFYRMLWKDREKAEDFMHDIFQKLIEKPEYYDRNKRKFKTWFFSVANNMCKNEYKKQGVRSITSSGLDESYNVSSTEEAVDRMFDNKMFKEKLLQEVNKLDDKHKEVFVMKYIDDLSNQEIADALDINLGTVKSRVFNAIKKISANLEVYRNDLIGGK